ncbi:MAG: hypothetical protein AAFO91_05230 [Bacteroidota bacterium]
MLKQAITQEYLSKPEGKASTQNPKATSLKSERSVMSRALELFRFIQNEEYSNIEQMKNPFVLIELSKLIHGNHF